MAIANDELSKRTKFAFISWCGANVGVMRKAKLSVGLKIAKREYALAAYISFWCHIGACCLATRYMALRLKRLLHMLQ